MSGNKLLAESTVRRFMKLASVGAMTDSFIKEMNYKDDEEELEEGGKKMVKHPKTGKMVPDYAVDGEGPEDEANESKIQTPEEENTLYEQRFTPKNNRLYEKLVKQWTK